MVHFIKSLSVFILFECWSKAKRHIRRKGTRWAASPLCSSGWPTAAHSSASVSQVLEWKVWPTMRGSCVQWCSANEWNPDFKSNVYWSPWVVGIKEYIDEKFFIKAIKVSAINMAFNLCKPRSQVLLAPCFTKEEQSTRGQNDGPVVESPCSTIMSTGVWIPGHTE